MNILVRHHSFQATQWSGVVVMCPPTEIDSVYGRRSAIPIPRRTGHDSADVRGYHARSAVVWRVVAGWSIDSANSLSWILSSCPSLSKSPLRWLVRSPTHS
jgi:hypothetical protein